MSVLITARPQAIPHRHGLGYNTSYGDPEAQHPVLDPETQRLEVQFGLVCLMLNIPVNNFSIMLGRSHRFLGITSTFGGKYVLLKDTTRRPEWGMNRDTSFLVMGLQRYACLTIRYISQYRVQDKICIAIHFKNLRQNALGALASTAEATRIFHL